MLRILPVLALNYLFIRQDSINRCVLKPEWL